jgi:AraC-like DNA-binding protein
MRATDQEFELLALLRPYVRQCGDHRRPAWQIGGRRLLDYLLVYIADGRGRFEVDGVALDAAPGDLFWIPPGVVHAMEGYPPSMDCPFLHFDLLYRPGDSHWEWNVPGGTTDLSRFGRRNHPALEHPLLDTLPGRIRAYNNHRVGGLIREIVAEHRRAQPHCELRLAGLMLEVVAEILRGQEGLAGHYGEHVPLLEETAAYIRDNSRRAIKVEDMAAYCELSPSHFRALFGRHFGCSPRTYLRRARVMHAKEMMIGSPLNLTEVAGRCGFASVHSFSRAFRATEGISPSEYRRAGARKYSAPMEQTTDG